MQIKKFEAPTIQEALENVKRELGPEAIILQTKKNRRGFGLLSKASVEITAAVSDRSLSKKTLVETRLPANSKEKLKSLPAAKQADVIEKYMNRREGAATQRAPQKIAQKGEALPKRITATRYIDILDEGQSAPSPASDSSSHPNASGQGALLEEVRILRKMVEDMKLANEKIVKRDESFEGLASTEGFLKQNSIHSAALQDAFEQLVINGVERKYAFALVKKVSFELGELKGNARGGSEQVLDSLAREVLDSIEVLPIFGQIDRVMKDRAREVGPTLIALVGPTGVGKTTTIAKLASKAVHEKKLKVGLVTLGSSKPYSFEQLGTYSKLLNLPFRNVESKEDLESVLKDLQSFDLVFVDTIGSSQKDAGTIQKVRSMLSLLPNLRIFLELAATAKDVELYDSVQRYSVLRPAGLIFSKLDEASVCGSLYNVSQRAKIPLSGFTTGQKVPDDFEEASPERVVALLMEL